MSGRYRALFIVLALLFLRCDRGLEPPPAAPFVSGTIHFTGTQPPCDSVRLLAVVLIDTTPPFLKQDLINGFLNGSIVAYSLEPCAFRDTTYRFDVTPGKSYGYIGVAQNYDTNLYNDWRVVGFLHDARDSAISIRLNEGESRNGADIRVRFDSLPRQPFQ